MSQRKFGQQPAIVGPAHAHGPRARQHRPQPTAALCIHAHTEHGERIVVAGAHQGTYIVVAEHGEGLLQGTRGVQDQTWAAYCAMVRSTLNGPIAATLRKARAAQAWG
jgi:hypothetical protein